MAAGVNPYILGNNSRYSGYPSAFGNAAGGYGGYGRINRYNPNLAATVSGPIGSSSGATRSAFATGQQGMREQEGRRQEASAEANATRQAGASAFAADQARSVAAYREARDNSQGAVAAREQTQEAGALGIDPSSSPKDIAAAASGGYHVGADGRIAGADTGNESVAPNQTDVRNAVVTQQAQRNGAQAATQATAYATGANSATGVAPTGANPFTAGIAPRATPNMTTSAMPGVPAQPATQPPVAPPRPQSPAPPAQPMARPPQSTSPFLAQPRTAAPGQAYSLGQMGQLRRNPKLAGSPVP